LDSATIELLLISLSPINFLFHRIAIELHPQPSKASGAGFCDF
jgi:hypothetical protein